MAVDPSARIHPSAIVEDGAEIGANAVVVGRGPEHQ